MIKKCDICNHVGELVWRDEKYYCAMCGSEVAETAPVVTPPQPVQPAQPAATVVSNATCPICKNKESNLFDGAKYRCALCGTTFDSQQANQINQYKGHVSTTNTYVPNTYAQTERYNMLKKEKDKNMIIGVVLICFFWPASLYFFYKAYQQNEEMKRMK